MQRNPLMYHHCNRPILTEFLGKESSYWCLFYISQRRVQTKYIKNLASQLKNIFHYHRWLSVRLEFLGNLMVFFAALLAVLAGSSIDSAIVGLSISYALNVSNNDFVVYDMFIMQLIKLSSPLPVWIIDCIN